VELTLEGRVALVTGAGSGIGRDFARILAEAGAAVACMGRRAEALEKTVSPLIDDGFEALAVPGDIAVREDVRRAVDAIRGWKGRLDILINNAGIYPAGMIAKMPEEDWLRTFDTNVNGAFWCTRAAAALMVENGYGRIINISSPSSLKGALGQSAYAASKAALNSLTQSSAAEFGRRGITANAIIMGVVPTESFVGMYSDSTVDVLAKRLPVARPCEAKDAAGLLLVLASDAGSYITGSVIPVDGGMTNVMPVV
jgi:3-oxoacyl-[acyl-carrier protein] reductase